MPTKSRFKISGELEARVNFWVKIYSHYDSRQGVFHLIEDPSRFNGVVNLEDIYNDESLSDIRKEILAESRIKRMKKFFMKRWNVRDASAIRLQMGLKDRMKTAFFHSGKYLKQMENIFSGLGLPIELTRLVFVESSFNVFAQSKVGASGLWQIMPATAREKGYIHRLYDYRNDPIFATKLAAQILKENYQELNSWPLAITAYNHGLAGVRKMTKRAQSLNIEDLIKTEFGTKSWGFASKNFYACFLAVLQVERQAEDLFEEDLYKSEPLVLKALRLPEPTLKEDIVAWFNGSWTRFRQLNPHLNWSLIKYRSSIPAGVPLMLPPEKYDLVRNDFYSE